MKIIEFAIISEDVGVSKRETATPFIDNLNLKLKEISVNKLDFILYHPVILNPVFSGRKNFLIYHPKKREVRIQRILCHEEWIKGNFESRVSFYKNTLKSAILSIKDIIIDPCIKEDIVYLIDETVVSGR